MRRFFIKNISWIIVTLTLLLMFGCGDNSEGIGPQPNTINLAGGHANPDSSLSKGGVGGYTLIESYGPLTIASVNTSSTLAPTAPAPNYGTEKYEVIGIETVATVDTVDGDLYTVPGGQSLYIGDGVDDGILAPGLGDTEITGLLVADKATLILPANNVGVSSIWLTNDIVINGEINTGSSTVDIDLQSTAGNLLIGSTGKVSTKPAAAGETAGSIYLECFGDFINKGVIDGSGADDGGASTSVTLKSGTGLSNSGSVLAQGGDDTSSAGTGGNITISAVDGVLYSSGTISAGGGNANNGNGGDGGLIKLVRDNNTSHGMLLSGTIHAYGGSAGDGDNGGDGGGLEIFTFANESVDIVGFDNIVLSGGEGETGGIGGDVYADTRAFDASTPAAPITTDINITVNGGYGSETGGMGGILDFMTDAHDTITSSGLSTFITNYGTLSADGGDGDTTGGDGGSIDLFSTGTGSGTINNGTLSALAGLNSTNDGTVTIDGNIQ